MILFIRPTCAGKASQGERREVQIVVKSDEMYGLESTHPGGHVRACEYEAGWYTWPTMNGC